MPGGITAATTQDPGGKVGRPSALTEATVNKLLAAILDLHTMEDAFRYAGVHPSTGMRWMQKGRAARSGEYRELYERVEDARVKAKAVLVRPVMARARLDPKIALEVLSRRFPEWQKRQKVEVEDRSPAKRQNVRDKVAAQLDNIEKRLAERNAIARTVAEADARTERDEDDDD